MESSRRIRRLRDGLGGILSTPGFSSVAGLVEDVDISSYCRGVVADVLLKNLKKKMAVSKKKEVVTDLLRGFGSYISTCNGMAGEVGRGEESQLVLTCKGKYPDIESEVMKTVMSDIGSLFVVSIEDVEHLERVRVEGLHVLRRVSAIGTQHMVSYLFPPFFLCALACAFVLYAKVRIYDAVNDESGCLKDLIDDVLGTWLHVFNAGVVDIELVGVEGGAVSNWVAFLVGCRHLMSRCIPYLRSAGLLRRPLADASENSVDEQNVAGFFPDVGKGDLVHILTTLKSLGEYCKVLMAEYYYPSVRKGSFQHIQAERDVVHVSAHITRLISRIHDDSDITLVGDMVSSIYFVATGCMNLSREWPVSVSRKFELSSRSGRFERKEVYELTVHLLVCVSVCMLCQTDLFMDVYEEAIESHVLHVLEHLLETAS